MQRTGTAITRALVACLGGCTIAALAGCTGNIGDPPDDDGNGTVSDGLCVVDTPIRRLTRFEYNNTVRDLLGDTTEPASVLPPEEEVQGFDNQAAALTVSDLLAEQYLKVAEDVSQRAIQTMLVQNGDALIPGCDPVAEGEDTCAAEFIEAFGQRAYRRPLTAEETARLMALFDTTMADPDLGVFATGIEVVIQAMLQSSAFLYRPEFGGEELLKEGSDVVKLTPWETASKLSYMLWNTMPDEDLFLAAEQDKLGTKEEVEAQARRMLGDPRAHSLRRWSASRSKASSQASPHQP